MNLRFILTGGPGAGKTSVCRRLQVLGFTCLPDVARHIIEARLKQGLDPRPEPLEFARCLVEANIVQYDGVAETGSPTFFDYSLVEALLMLRECGVSPYPIEQEVWTRPYNELVFYFPPWEAIYAQDQERDQTFGESQAVADRIKGAYEALGFTLVAVPLLSPAERADFILAAIRDMPN